NTMNDLKSSEKDGDLSQDEHHDYANEIQQLTDRYVGKIDEALANKEQEITQV
ncbi:MAG: ribosome recycling factor, partial [Proteobacteria bacterium]|nr:ribosome recycling factor [Pseudomonadota bacterium]